MDYTIALDDEQVRRLVKPFVELMIDTTRRLFPDADFQYTADEFMRDTPGRYQLRITWQLDAGSFYFTMLELVQPLGLDTLTLRFVHSSLLFHPNWPEVAALFGQQIEVNQAEGPGPHLLRLTW